MNAVTSFLPSHPKATDSYKVLRAINCKDHVERKNGLAYLSWAWAVDILLQHDPDANWTFGEPKQYGETMMVSCSVTAFGRTRTCPLPVMDHRNRAIANPDAFAVNTAQMRALVKAIALHGLGLYIYAGEDLPEGETSPPPEPHLTPRGDLGRGPKEQYQPWADKMLAILNAHASPESHEAERRALMSCLDLHDTLRVQGDNYVGASDCLTAAQRAGWKKLVKMAQDLERQEA